MAFNISLKSIAKRFLKQKGTEKIKQEIYCSECGKYLKQFAYNFFKGKKVCVDCWENEGFLYTSLMPDEVGLASRVYFRPKMKLKSIAKILVGKKRGKEYNLRNTFEIDIDGKINGDIGELNKKNIIEIKKFVLKNKETIIKHWEGLSSSSELIKELNIIIPE